MGSARRYIVVVLHEVVRYEDLQPLPLTVRGSLKAEESRLLIDGRCPKLDEEWMRLAKEVLVSKLIDTVYLLEQKIGEGKINEQGNLVIIIKKEELEKIRKDLELERP